jgi:hypothetical protein
MEDRPGQLRGGRDDTAGLWAAPGHLQVVAGRLELLAADSVGGLGGTTRRQGLVWRIGYPLRSVSPKS